MSSVESLNKRYLCEIAYLQKKAKCLEEKVSSQSLIYLIELIGSTELTCKRFMYSIVSHVFNFHRSKPDFRYQD